MNKKVIIGCIVAVALIGIIVLAICIGGKKEDVTPQNNATNTEKTEGNKFKSMIKEVTKNQTELFNSENLSLEQTLILYETCQKYIETCFYQLNQMKT